MRDFFLRQWLLLAALWQAMAFTIQVIVEHAPKQLFSDSACAVKAYSRSILTVGRRIRAAAHVYGVDRPPEVARQDWQVLERVVCGQGRDGRVAVPGPAPAKVPLVFPA